MERRLLKFEASWCAPCHALDPLAKQLATRHGLDLERIDVDEFPEVAEEYSIRSIPTLVLMNDDEELARTSGARVIGILERELGLKALERVS